MDQSIKNLPAMWEIWVWFQGWEDPLEEHIATYASILAWRIPGTEEPAGCSPKGCKESDTTKRLGIAHYKVSCQVDIEKIEFLAWVYQ